MYEAKILADSVSPQEVRLTTMQVTFPRIVLAEFNTHRMLSRNSASSRAIPVKKMLEKVRTDPFIPIWWGKNQKGMQASIELTYDERQRATDEWLAARDAAVQSASLLAEDLDVHKQIANRLLEPFLWHTVIVTATDWDNFFNLRTHKDAQPEIREIALMMQKLYRESTPTICTRWHLPLVTEEESIQEIEGIDWAMVSAGRCARVSYLTHEGKRDPKADMELAIKLVNSGHMSPMEHQATPKHSEPWRYHGNFRGWIQLRKLIPGEHIYVP